jgi:hypothetical protein
MQYGGQVTNWMMVTPLLLLDAGSQGPKDRMLESVATNKEVS